MNRRFFRIIPVFVLVTMTSWQSIDAQQLRAVLPFGRYAGRNPNHCYSEQAISTYKNLGYNTIFEFIDPPADPADWNLPAYTIKSAKRMELVSYVKQQKKYLNDQGMNYCPFFNEWGHGQVLPRINVRTRADVYKEPVVFSGNYYGVDIYTNLSKLSDGWSNSPNLTYSWNPDMNILRFDYSGKVAGCGRSIIRTMDYTANPISSIPDKLINDQCYEVTYTVDLTNANLAIGDEIRMYCFRQYADGQKPDPANVPLGKIERTTTNDREVLEKNYVVKSVSPYTFDYATVSSSNIMVLKDTIWTEKFLDVAAGRYFFNDYFRLDFIVDAKGTHSGNMTFTINSLKPINPRNIVANDLWETSPHYSYYRNNYPYERLRETKGIYQVGGLTVENRLYLDPPPYGGILKGVKGHFTRWNNDAGKGMARQFTVDPLSPVTDLVTKEMLRVIREGLGNTEPPYFFITSDEVNVFRRDKLNCKNGSAGTPYNTLGNLAYWGKIVRNHIERYKLIFGGNINAKAKTTFITWGDMALPFASGYHFYADNIDDNSGIQYLADTKGTDKISVAIWEYDYMDIPTCPGCLRGFALHNPIFMQNIIEMVTNKGLDFVAWYATDGNKLDLNSVEPTDRLLDDYNNIQHEIDLARKWCDYATRNSPSFTGYGYSGWDAYFKANRWNGLYSLAYFGWIDPDARDFQESWKSFTSPGGDNGDPVLEMTNIGGWRSPGDVYSYSYQEALHENNISKPRIQVFNANESLSDFTVHYYFMVEQGKTPVLEDYWTEHFDPRLNQIQNSLWEVQFHYTGAPLKAMDIYPRDGIVVGLHYSDWSVWDKTKDYSFYDTNRFKENNRIVITNNSGEVLFGYKP